MSFSETLIFRYKHGESIIFNVVLIRNYQSLDLGRFSHIDLPIRP